MALSDAQRNALHQAINGKGLWRMEDGHWIPLSKKSEPITPKTWRTSTHLVTSLMAKGVLMPQDRSENGTLRSVAVEWNMAKSVLAAA